MEKEGSSLRVFYGIVRDLRGGFGEARIEVVLANEGNLPDGLMFFLRSMILLADIRMSKLCCSLPDYSGLSPARIIKGHKCGLKSQTDPGSVARLRPFGQPTSWGSSLS